MQVATTTIEKPIYNGHTHWAYPEHISKVMDVNFTTLRMYLKRKGFEVFKAQPLSKEALVVALDKYAKDEATKKEADKIAVALGLDLDLKSKNIEVKPPEVIKPVIKPQVKNELPRRERWGGRSKKKKKGDQHKESITAKAPINQPSEPERWFISIILSAAIPFAIYSYSELFLGMTSNDVAWYLYAVFIAAVIVQVEHTCVMAYRFSTVSNEIVKWTSSGLFALSFQFTGFILTIHSGSHWYLLSFAIAEVFINIFYYSPWRAK